MSMTAVNYNVSNSTEVLTRANLIVCSRRRSFPSVGIFYGENPMDFSFPLLMVELSLVVIITQLVRHILKPLRQPRIVAEIIGGIIVGQIAVSSSAKFRKYMFPADARFVLRNIGLLGFMFFLFIAALKTDVRLIKRAGKKQWIIVIASVIAPMICGITVAANMPKETIGGQFSSMFGITSLFSVTAFPVLNPIIKELNLLSSEIGRLGLSLTLISVVMGINFSVIFESAHQGALNAVSGLWSMLSFLLFTAGILIGIRRAMCRLVKETPPGKPIPEVYVVAILVGVMLTGFLSDTFGMAICNGPMWLGLAIPDGPPLGAILVEKTEAIVNNFLMPLGYVFLGMTVDLYLIQEQWPMVECFIYVAVTAVVIKIIATFLASYFVKLPVKEALALSLLLSLRGQMEILLLIRFTDLRMITGPSAAAMVLIILVTDAISTFVVSMLLNATRPYMVNKRRTIQHTPPNSELRVIACFFDDNNVIGVLSLLDLSNSSSLALTSPICIYALHLVELVAQAQPIRIEHDTEEMDFEESSYPSSLYRVLERFKNTIRPDIEIHLLTIITAKKTMYQDICEIALLKKVSLIVLPFEQDLITGTIPVTVPMISNTPTTDSTTRNTRQLNNDVLDQAPCSVAIFANTNVVGDNNLLRLSGRKSSRYHVIVFFLGGADSREALSYADRITANQNVSLTVIRFLSRDERGDDKMEKKLDDGLITWFWVKHEASRRVFYKEVVVANGEDTISAIQDLATDNCQLFILGRKHGINPVLLQGLTDWSENNELGPLGDYIASSEIGRKASLIVMQQQILRG